MHVLQLRTPSLEELDKWQFCPLLVALFFLFFLSKVYCQTEKVFLEYSASLELNLIQSYTEVLEAVLQSCSHYAIVFWLVELKFKMAAPVHVVE